MTIRLDARRSLMWLLFVAILSFVVPNGLFLYWLLHDLTTFQAALQNRLALAFILDVFLTTGVLAAYFAKSAPGRYRWPWFLAFSLLGTLCFGLAFYWWLSKRSSGAATTAT